MNTLLEKLSAIRLVPVVVINDAGKKPFPSPGP